MKIEAHSLKESQILAQRIAKHLQVGMLITLHGELGVGKTTFTKALGKALGVESMINSPTFTILKTYQGRLPFYHIDAYRLEGMNQELGFEEYFEGDGVCVIEWASFIEDFLPTERLSIHIDVQEDTRIFTLAFIGSKYEAIWEECR